MSEHFNKLTPAEAERLAMLAEECAEVIVEINKALRHGFYSYHPDQPHLMNHIRIAKELVDVEAVVNMMFEAGDLSYARTGSRVAEAMQKKLRFAHHQEAPTNDQ